VDVGDGIELLAGQTRQAPVPVAADARQMRQHVRLGAAVEERDIVASRVGALGEVSADELGAAEDEQAHRYSTSRHAAVTCRLGTVLRTQRCYQRGARCRSGHRALVWFGFVAWVSCRAWKGPPTQR